MQHVPLKKPHDFCVLVESLVTGNRVVTGNRGELALAELAINPTYEKGSDQQAAWDLKVPMGSCNNYYNSIESFFRRTLNYNHVIRVSMFTSCQHVLMKISHFSSPTGKPYNFVLMHVTRTKKKYGGDFHHHINNYSRELAKGEGVR